MFGKKKAAPTPVVEEKKEKPTYEHMMNGVKAENDDGKFHKFQSMKIYTPHNAPTHICLRTLTGTSPRPVSLE